METEQITLNARERFERKGSEQDRIAPVDKIF